MDDVWAQLLRYKMAEDKLNELKLKVWKSLPFDAEVKVSLEDAEEDLADLKQMIEINGPVNKAD